MRIYELKRKARIEQLLDSLKEAQQEGRDVDMAQLVLLVMGEHGVTRATAKEYIEIAQAQLKWQEGKSQ